MELNELIEFFYREYDAIIADLKFGKKILEEINKRKLNNEAIEKGVELEKDTEQKLELFSNLIKSLELLER